MTTTAEVIASGRASLGIELGSTNIKACLIDTDQPTNVLATGSFRWENTLTGGLWTYDLADVWRGIAAAYADLVSGLDQAPRTLASLGVSAMMHGYLAFDDEGELLVPFRTWRNTNTADAAAELSDLFDVNIPLRWSVAHVRQAMLDGEAHVPQVRYLTTLAGYVHWQLTGHKVLGVGDASGMFPIDATGTDFDAALIERFDALDGADQLGGLRGLLPRVLVARDAAGTLTQRGASLLDATGTLQAGVALCAPEGDAGTGMVATGAVAPRTGNVSVGTSIFAMLVLERPLAQRHGEIDLVATPSGDAVAMVHCNNGASELGETVGLFSRFASAAGVQLNSDQVFETLLTESLAGEEDAGGIVAYNLLAGEPVVDLAEGRPLVVRTPGSTFSLANFMRAQVYGVFASLALGMTLLNDEGVEVDRLLGHGGIFRTAGVAQQYLASALDTPISVAATASEGGPWGIAVLAAYAASSTEPLADYLTNTVFANANITTVEPNLKTVRGFATYLERFRSGLAIESAAISAL